MLHIVLRGAFRSLMDMLFTCSSRPNSITDHHPSDIRHTHSPAHSAARAEVLSNTLYFAEGADSRCANMGDCDGGYLVQCDQWSDHVYISVCGEGRSRSIYVVVL